MKILTNYVGTLIKCVVVIFAMVGVVSCQKSKNDDPAPPPATVIDAKGYWTGNYITTGVLGQTKYAILINAGGSARVYDLDASTDTTLIAPLSKSNGTWVLDGTTIQVSYTNGGKNYVNNGTINTAATTISGTWSRDGVVKGTISLTK